MSKRKAVNRSSDLVTEKKAKEGELKESDKNDGSSEVEKPDYFCWEYFCGASAIQFSFISTEAVKLIMEAVNSNSSNIRKEGQLPKPDYPEVRIRVIDENKPSDRYVTFWLSSDFYIQLFKLSPNFNNQHQTSPVVGFIYGAYPYTNWSLQTSGEFSEVTSTASNALNEVRNYDINLRTQIREIPDPEVKQPDEKKKSGERLFHCLDPNFSNVFPDCTHNQRFYLVSGKLLKNVQAFNK